MGLTAIECPDGVCHSHHGGHSVERSTMQETLKSHGRDWCERLAERIYEISVDTFSQSVMPSLHSAGWQRRHLDWEFKLSEQESEPDRTLVDGIINATESFLRSSEVHRLFIQELVQGTFDEAAADSLRIKAVRTLVETEIVAMLDEKRLEMIERLSQQLMETANNDQEAARRAAEEALIEVERLVVNHAEAL
ncbi:MAG: EF-1 guanine nucleotide exchange domain-containing protein [Cyanobium sp. NAT70]|nr:EF-1 guanine nucleotide exchange domain-containing protein [Cyanobium sp. NAT70]